MRNSARVEIGEPQTLCLGPKLSVFRYSYSLGLSMVRHEPDQRALAQRPRRHPLNERRDVRANAEMAALRKTMSPAQLAAALSEFNRTN